jgi:hypothetical protein
MATEITLCYTSHSQWDDMKEANQWNYKAFRAWYSNASNASNYKHPKHAFNSLCKHKGGISLMRFPIPAEKMSVFAVRVGNEFWLFDGSFDRTIAIFDRTTKSLKITDRMAQRVIMTKIMEIAFVKPML